MFFFFGPFDTAGAPTPFQPSSLADVPGLERLPEVCNKFDVEITAFGSLVRRLAFQVLDQEGETPDLFALAPFLSDIDLRHSGSSEQTSAIRAAILDCVPWSEYFRWEISSEIDLKPFLDDEVHLPVIPLNRMRLSTMAASGIQDPRGAAEDIRTKKFRLMESEFYERSELRKNHRDCELLHAVFFLELLCEHGGETPPSNHPGWPVCQKLVKDSLDSVTSISLAESSYLRARLGYRLKSLCAACKSESQWQEVIVASGLTALPGLGIAGNQETLLPTKPESSRVWPIVSSCRLGGDVFRLGGRPLSGTPAMEGQQAWDTMVKDNDPLEAFSKCAIPKLADNQEIVASGPRIQFAKGFSSCSSGDEQVHVEFALTETGAARCSEVGDTHLGVLAVLIGSPRSTTSENRPQAYVVPLPSVCTHRNFGRDTGNVPLLRIRVNFGRILNVFPGLLRQAGLSHLTDYSLQLFIIADLD